MPSMTKRIRREGRTLPPSGSAAARTSAGSRVSAGVEPVSVRVWSGRRADGGAVGVDELDLLRRLQPSRSAVDGGQVEMRAGEVRHRTDGHLARAVDHYRGLFDPFC